MKVEVLYFEGCPNHAPMVERVREALRSENERADVQEIEIRTQAEAESMPSSDLIRRAVNEQRTSHDSCCQTNPGGSPTPTSTVGSARGTGSRRAALFAGGIAAVLASACCLGPLILVTVGVSGAWIGNLTRLEPYRPIFIVIAVVALFFAWRSIYRPASACAPGAVCAVPQIRRLYKVLFWASVALTVLALLYPYFAKYFY